MLRQKFHGAQFFTKLRMVANLIAVRCSTFGLNVKKKTLQLSMIFKHGDSRVQKSDGARPKFGVGKIILRGPLPIQDHGFIEKKKFDLYETAFIIDK